jgi:transmembrane sensor
MNKEQAKEIIERYNQGQANAEEKAWLDNWYLQESRKHQFSAQESDFLHLKEEIWKATKERSGLGSGYAAKKISLWPRIAAAVALILFGAGMYFYMEPGKPRLKDIAMANHIVPGGNKAILTLANGSEISLTDAVNGTITRQAGTTVTKTKNGQLLYAGLNSAQGESALAYNTITTPKGGQYQITLVDGTRVWLNASSSLHYPTVFNGAERKVQLTGEAYFEVAKNPKMPFRVMSNGQVTEVLGTHFNINSYQDEPGTTITLLEGSVRVLDPKSEAAVMLKPGQQSSSEAGGRIKVANVNPEQFVAWKDGKFVFTNANIESIMRQVSRWYNVEIEYKGSASKEKFGGRTSRFTNVAELLEILELTDHVQFEIEGRRIIVMP